jgi:hypothetical protein
LGVAQLLADVLGDELGVLAAAVDASPHHPRQVQPVLSLPVIRVLPCRHPILTNQPIIALHSYSQKKFCQKQKYT